MGRFTSAIFAPKGRSCQSVFKNRRIFARLKPGVRVIVDLQFTPGG